MFLGGQNRIRAPGALSYKPAKLQVGAGNRLSWPSSNAGIRVFPIAAIFSQENSIQNFPSFCVSLVIYFNSLLLLFAQGNQRLLLHPSPRVSVFPFGQQRCRPSKAMAFHPYFTRSLQWELPVLLQRDFQSLLQIWSFISPSEQRTDARLSHPWAGPLGEAHLKLRIWLAKKEQSIGEGEYILIWGLCLCQAQPRVQRWHWEQLGASSMVPINAPARDDKRAIVAQLP